jgi:hypothetical protein
MRPLSSNPSGPRPIGADVAKSLRKTGVLKGAQAAWVVVTANTQARGRFIAESFRDGVLVIRPGTIPAPELVITSHDLTEAINKKLGRTFVRAIRVKASKS